MYDLVYGQLEAQNAVGMIDDFMEIFIPEIEFEVMQKYGVGIVPYSVNAHKTFCFTHGGMVAYETLDGRKIVQTYFDQEDTRAYIKDVYSFTVYDLIMGIMGLIPITAPFASPLCLIQTIVNSTTRDDINNADDRAQITTIEDPDYGPVSAACGWYNYPMSIRYNMDNCQSLEEVFFPAK